MKKHLLMLLIAGLSGTLLLSGCDSAEEDDPLLDDGDSSGGDSDTSETPLTCDIDVLETFDTGIPAGWTVLGGGGGSGSGSGSGSGGGTVEVNEEETWHHTTVDDALIEYEGMEGGYMFVGGFAGMDESLVTDFITIGSCQSVSLMFDSYFDDQTRNEADRGELWITVDGPPAELIGTFDVAGLTESTIDLMPYLTGGMAFQLTFVFKDEEGGNYGWAIDNVQVTGAP
jgi:hypothetical protein